MNISEAILDEFDWLLLWLFPYLVGILAGPKNGLPDRQDMSESRSVSSSFTKLLIFAGLLLLGCAYEPSEEFFNEVKSIEPLASIDLSEYNDRDTILLEQPTTFNFNVDISHPSRIQIAEVLLDSKPIVASYSGTGVFTLSQSYITLGNHV